jgi:class 3 adenylate cyclase
LAARVAALAGSDEILVSSTVRDLVVGSGIRFADRGSRVLKGVPGRWRLYAAELKRTYEPEDPSGERESLRRWLRPGSRSR